MKGCLQLPPISTSLLCARILWTASATDKNIAISAGARWRPALKATLHSCAENGSLILAVKAISTPNGFPGRLPHRTPPVKPVERDEGPGGGPPGRTAKVANGLMPTAGFAPALCAF